MHDWLTWYSSNNNSGRIGITLPDHVSNIGKKNFLGNLHWAYIKYFRPVALKLWSWGTCKNDVLLPVFSFPRGFQVWKAFKNSKFKKLDKTFFPLGNWMYVQNFRSVAQKLWRLRSGHTYTVHTNIHTYRRVKQEKPGANRVRRGAPYWSVYSTGLWNCTV